VRKRYDAQSLILEHMELLRMDYQAFAERYEGEGRDEPAQECRKQADRWEERQRRFMKEVQV
jgi:hypothetical protein